MSLYMINHSSLCLKINAKLMFPPPLVNFCIITDNMKKIKKFEGMTPVQTSITFWLLIVHMFSNLKSCNWKQQRKGKYQSQKVM